MERCKRKRRISSFLRFVPTKVDRADQHVAASSSIFVKIKGNTSMSIRTISFSKDELFSCNNVANNILHATYIQVYINLIVIFFRKNKWHLNLLIFI